MSNGGRILTIPRHNPVNAFTLGGIVRDAGLTVEEFREFLLPHAAQLGVAEDCAKARRLSPWSLAGEIVPWQ